MATIPNLNITVPNANVPDQESDEDIDKVDVKYFEPLADISAFEDDELSRDQHKLDADEDEGEIQDAEVTVYLKQDKKSQRKRYLNPVAAALSIDEGDLKADEDSLRKRAQRFNISSEHQRISEEELASIYDEFQINPDEVKDQLKYRLNALHLRGVTNLSTDEIFKHFADLAPTEVEWINDISCNVVWPSANLTAKVLLQMAKPLVKIEGESYPSPLLHGKKAEKSAAMDEDENPETDKIFEVNVEMREETESPAASSAEHLTNEKFNEVNVNKVVIPPGTVWRVLKPHRKAAVLLVRYATRNDVKLQGAAADSDYYRRHGNPNFSGIKGIISSSMRRRMNRQNDGLLVKTDYSSVVDLRNALGKRRHSESSTSTFERSNKSEDDEDMEDVVSKPKKLRMKMHADVEEEKIRKRRLASASRGNDLRSVLRNRFRH